MVAPVELKEAQIEQECELVQQNRAKIRKIHTNEDIRRSIIGKEEVLLGEAKEGNNELEEFIQEQRKFFEETRTTLSSIEVQWIRNNNEKRINSNRDIIDREKTLVQEIRQNQNLEIRVAGHNINGLKSRSQKAEALLDWEKSEQLNIIGVVETNILEREGSF